MYVFILYSYIAFGKHIPIFMVCKSMVSLKKIIIIKNYPYEIKAFDVLDAFL